MISIKGISLKAKLATVLVVLVASSLLYQWYKPAEPTIKAVAQAPAAKAVAGVEKHEVPANKLVVYDKKKVAKKVDLPQSVIDDPEDEVTSVSDVAASKAGVTVTTVVDKQTGETTVYQEIKKEPLFGFGGLTKVGVGYGLGRIGVEKNIHAEYQFIRVGNVYGSVRGEVNDRGEVRGAVNADYQW